MEERRNVCSLLVGKPEGKSPLGRPRHRWMDNIKKVRDRIKRPLGRPRCRWMDNIKKDLLEIGLNVVDWIGLVQDRYSWMAFVNSVMNLGVP
jgi:hypothetical protein